MFGSFSHYTQTDSNDCGIACLRMIARYHGRNFSEQELTECSHATRNGVSMHDLCDAATFMVLEPTGVKLSLAALREKALLPCILHWNHTHFVVCYKIKRKKHRTLYYIADPASRNLVYSEKEFVACWGADTAQGCQGVALFLKPTESFYKHRKRSPRRNAGLGFLYRYFSTYRRGLFMIFMAMLIISMLQLIAPFLMQATIDLGVNGRNLHVIELLLIAQLMIFASGLVVSMIRSWAMLYMNTKISISLVSDFLAKLLKMPFRFFDTKLMGDISQRIRDNERIQNFLTGSSVETMFSMINFVVFAVILACYNPLILLIFISGNILYIVWTQSFMRYKTALDLKRFNQMADEQDVLFQMISGIKDIKLNNCEQQKRWQWERIQAQQFHIRVKTLTVSQLQQLGSVFFSQTTSILISYIAAMEVVNGQITFGMMMAISYIIGQISTPVNNLIDFLTAFQYARLSMERLNEIHQQKDEEQQEEQGMTVLPEDRTISLSHVYFSYSGADRNYVLKDIDIVIPANKVTAVVGASGSGKTTLLKLILGFYQPNHGSIRMGNVPIDSINCHAWRNAIGSVLQDGYLFSDDIARNIALGEDTVDMDKVGDAAAKANIDAFVQSLPLGYHTKIGMDGNGLSQGQKQRLLIARAVYKNPQLLLLDEATNSLDANNEKEIVRHLEDFYHGKTVIIAAHRLSTIRHADQIVVLDQGHVVECGSHADLMNLRGAYYKLICAQLGE